MKCSFFILLACTCLLTSCSGRYGCYGGSHPSKNLANSNQYARRAYREQQALEQAPVGSTYQDEVTEEDLILTLDDSEYDWQRYPYETVEEWNARIHSVMRLNHDALVLLTEEFNNLTQHERVLVSDIQTLSRNNERLRTVLSDRVVDKEPDILPLAARNAEEISLAPFTLHMVRQGETLYSIARHYYGDTTMVTDIMLWNQGWIRHPEELIAGLSIILFPADSLNKNPQVVETYLRSLNAVQ